MSASGIPRRLLRNRCKLKDVLHYRPRLCSLDSDLCFLCVLQCNSPGYLVSSFIAGSGPRIARPKPFSLLTTASTATPTLAGNITIVTGDETSTAAGESSGAPESATSGAAQSTAQSCSDVVSFEVTHVADIGFSSDQPASDVQECAKLCYQAGCKTAAFSVDPEPKCLMNFETQNCNPSASRYTEYAVNGTDVAQIQCILCGYLTVDEPVDFSKAPEGEGATITSVGPSSEEATTVAVEGTSEISGLEGSASNETVEGVIPVTTGLADGEVTDAPGAVTESSEGAPSEDQTSVATGEPSLVTSEAPVVEATDESAAAESGADSSHSSSDKSAGCGGRLQFQVVAVNNMPHLNVTNDISATSPAECAKKCFDAPACKMAGFIPSPSGELTGGVCLLTTDPEICLNDVQFTPQHASLTPFVVSCLQCTQCNYQLSSATPDRVLPDFEEKEEASSVSDCAQRCSNKKCTMARFSATARTCEMTVSTFIGYDQCEAKAEPALTTDGSLPVLLQCVNCSS
uniref:Apple domain-containing protein n=1 Tax=Plectus sambesii TaxID=2011161 RepID=A0A914X7P6_9BILA